MVVLRLVDGRKLGGNKELINGIVVESRRYLNGCRIWFKVETVSK